MIKIDEKRPAVIKLRTEEAKLMEIRRERASEQKKLDEMVQKFMAQNTKKGRDKLEAEADELLQGKHSTLVSQDDIAQLEHRLSVLQVAIEMQEQVVSIARGRYSRTVCELNRPEYIRIEKRLTKAVEELAAANEAEYRFFEELTDADVSSINLRPMRLERVGRLSDPQSLANFHRQEMQEHVPEAIQ